MKCDKKGCDHEGIINVWGYGTSRYFCYCCRIRDIKDDILELQTKDAEYKKMMQSNGGCK